MSEMRRAGDDRPGELYYRLPEEMRRALDSDNQSGTRRHDRATTEGKILTKYHEGIARVGLFFESLEREGVAPHVLDDAAELFEEVLPYFVKREGGAAYLNMERLMPNLTKRIKQLGGDFTTEAARTLAGGTA